MKNFIEEGTAAIRRGLHLDNGNGASIPKDRYQYDAIVNPDFRQFLKGIEREIGRTGWPYERSDAIREIYPTGRDPEEVTNATAFLDRLDQYRVLRLEPMGELSIFQPETFRAFASLHYMYKELSYRYGYDLLKIGGEGMRRIVFTTRNLLGPYKHISDVIHDSFMEGAIEQSPITETPETPGNETLERNSAAVAIPDDIEAQATNYYDTIADVDLRTALVQFEQQGKPVTLAELSVRKVTEEIAAALDVIDSNMITNFRNLQGTARKEELVNVVQVSGRRNLRKYNDPSDIRVLFILLRERAKHRWPRHAGFTNLVMSISVQIGKEHELYKKFQTFLDKKITELDEKTASRDAGASGVVDDMWQRDLTKSSSSLTREQAMNLLKGKRLKDWEELLQYLVHRTVRSDQKLDFNKLEPWVFSAIQLAVRAQAVTRGKLDEFDPRLTGITYPEGVEVVRMFLGGTLSDPRVAQFDGSKLYEFMDVMERLARNKKEKKV